MQQLVFIAPRRLEWQEIDAPTIRRDTDAIVAPVLATTCDLDHLIIQGGTPLQGPFAMGHECVARVCTVGAAVRSVRPGDIVAVPWHLSCYACDRCRGGHPVHCRTMFPSMFGLPWGPGYGGMFAELIRVPFADTALVPLPPDVRPQSAVSLSDNLPLAYEITVPHLLAHPGADVLVMGGSGSIGLFAVDLALAAGARRVDFIDTDRQRLVIAERLGATAREEPAPKRAGEYAITVDASFDPKALQCALRSTAPGGVCSSVGVYFEDVALPLFEMFVNKVTFHIGISHARARMYETLDFLSARRIRPELAYGGTFSLVDAADVLRERTLKPVFVGLGGCGSP